MRDGGRSHLKHGAKRADGGTPEYDAWIQAKNRCNNYRSENYKDYGGRGIRMWPGWLNNFPAFYKHIGPRPSPKHSLDRIDNDGHYEPGNIRWATAKEQAANKRKRHFKIR
jgi:hypothetical protein